VSYREGFKSGGFQYLSATAPASEITFDPEEVTLYEGGIKARSPRGRVALDAAVFTTDYQDLQFLAATGTTTGGGFIVAITNAAQATADGVELDLTLRPASGLEVGLGYGWLDATFDEYVDGNGKDNSGNTLLRSPEGSGHAVVQYGFPLSDTAGALTLRAMWSTKDKIYFDPDNTERLAQPSYDLLDASVAYDTAEGRWRVTAWGKNLADEEYYKNVIPLSSSLVGVATMGVPRTYGVTLARQW
jgi:iron complex outermembrane receptor protein